MKEWTITLPAATAYCHCLLPTENLTFAACRKKSSFSILAASTPN
jgi:hypothetical protein